MFANGIVASDGVVSSYELRCVAACAVRSFSEFVYYSCVLTAVLVYHLHGSMLALTLQGILD